MSVKKFLYLLMFLLSAAIVPAQNNLRFEYQCYDALGREVDTEVSISTPDSDILQLYSGTEKYFSEMKEGFFKEGQYLLRVRSESCFFPEDLLDYPIELTGRETDVDIKVRFYYEEDLFPDQVVRKVSDPEMYIFVTKYYEKPPDVAIKLAVIELSGHFDYYEPPFFHLTNYSRDTLYGEYLPGHFIGTMSCGGERRQWDELRLGSIDLNFKDVPPLAPDYTTVAMVSPEGLSESSGNCRYELIYSTRRNPEGFTTRIGNSALIWQTQEKEYYRLLYDFALPRDAER